MSSSYEEVCSLEVANPIWPGTAPDFSHFQFDTSVKAIHYRSLSSIINVRHSNHFILDHTPRIVIKVVFGLDREYVHNRFRFL